MGDFNVVTNREEVNNKETFSQSRCTDFNDWITDEGLVDLGYTGTPFTWSRGKDSTTFRAARLDRVLCSIDWLDVFPHANVTNLLACNSDQSPILLNLTNSNNCKNDKFKFQAP